MGHARHTFTFSLKTSEKAIAETVTDWSYENVDLREIGVPSRREYSIDVWFERNNVFNSFDEAAEYAGKAWRDAVAVKYKEYPPFKPTKAMDELARRISEYDSRIAALDEPHYANVKQTTVKCKCCGAVLPTEYCGKSYKNNCPVCRADLRPDSALSKLNGYKKTVADLRKRLEEETKKINAKNASKAVIKWCVCCDVHC